jgi:hypothetical protein
MDASLDVLLLKHMCDIVVFKQLTDRVICNLSLRHFGTKCPRQGLRLGPSEIATR